MRFALTELFKAHRTDDIHNEWINALLRGGKHSKEILQRTRDLMDLHVRDAQVTGYEMLIDGVTFPDRNDRHVLAATRITSVGITAKRIRRLSISKLQVAS